MNAKPAAAAPDARRPPAPDLQIADAPTVVVLSTTGRAVRVDLADGQALDRARAPQQARRDPGDRAPRRPAASSARSRRAGRLLRFTPVDLPSVPPASVQLGGRRAAARLPRHHRQERARARPRPLRRRHAARARHAAGRRQAHRALGAARPRPSSRSSASSPATRSWAPRRRPTAPSSSSSPATRSCCASPRRRCGPQGAPAGGMAGINVSPKASVVFFGAVDGGGCRRGHDLRGRRACSRAPMPGASRSRVSRSSRQGPRHRRRARARVPQGRRPADASRGSGPAPARAVGPDGAARPCRTRRPSGTRRVSRSTP